jgi:hypothetical protein
MKTGWSFYRGRIFYSCECHTETDFSVLPGFKGKLDPKCCNRVKPAVPASVFRELDKWHEPLTEEQKEQGTKIIGWI